MRPFVLSVAGLDPSGGAGILADVKTFESIGTQGFAVCTAITYQRDDYFEKSDWLTDIQIIHQIELLIQKFELNFCKIGLIKDLDCLKSICNYLYKKNIKIILDPILTSSSGFVIHTNSQDFLSVLEKVYVLTPNFIEMKQICNGNLNNKTGKKILEHTNIYLKGGHHPKRLGTDYLFTKEYALPFAPQKGKYYEKHGSGCILSAALTAYLAKGEDLKTACFKAKEYTAKALSSNPTLLAYHNLQQS